jgi:hypothetical protein
MSAHDLKRDISVRNLGAAIQDTHYFDLINNFTFLTYNATFHAHGQLPDAYVVIDPYMHIYGGFGNLMQHFFGAIAVAVSSRRVLLLNIPLLNALFEHPDSPRQTWGEFNLSLVLADHDIKQAYPDCKDFIDGSKIAKKKLGRFSYKTFHEVPSLIL